MRSRKMMWLLLGGLMLFGTGAAVDGVREARDWQWAADLARANHQPLEAYCYYVRTAQAFPDTPHGRLAAKRAERIHRELLKPQQSPAAETPCNWGEELVDFLTWP